MKKITALFITLSFVISSVLSFVSFAEEKPVFSESFENGIASWKLNKDEFKGNFIVEEGSASDGKKSLKINDNNADTTMYITSDTFDAAPGTEYTVCYDAFVNEGKGLKLYLQFKDAGGKTLYSKSMYASGSAWKTFTVKHTAPEGTAKGCFVIWAQDKDLGVCSFDNIKIFKGGVSSVITPSVPVKSGDIVFADDFENGSGKWVALSKTSNGETTRIDNMKANEGKGALHVIDKDTETAYGIRTKTNIPATENTAYTVSADIFNVEGMAAKIFVLYLDKDGNRILNKSAGATGTGKWERVSLTETAPQGTVAIQIHLTGARASTGETFIDNFKITVGEKLVETKEAALSKKLSALKPGETYEMEDGVYTDLAVILSEKGTSDKPITIKAKNPGKVVFKGTSNFQVKGSYYILDGLKFEECTNKNLVYFDVSSKNCQLKNSAFINCDSKTGSQFQVQLRGEAITVSSCYFSGKSTVGQFIECARSESKKEVGAKHKIENCYFGNIKLQSGNGYEAVRLGLSQTCFDDYSVILEKCFFYMCNGEGEPISVKGNGTSIRYNTFYNNQGAIVLRHGDDCKVYGNLFIGGENTSRVTGVRITGERQKVYNNYFYNLPPQSTTFMFSNGNPYEGIENHWYYPVVDADVHNNTFIGGDKTVIIGKYSPSKEPSSNLIMAPQGKFYNNAIITYTGENEIIKNGDNNHKIQFENNFVYGKELGYNGDLKGISYGKFNHTKIGKYITFDNGIGADITEVDKAPKSPYDIICDWVKKDLYDTGIMKFEPVEGDPFNTEFDSEALIPKGDKVNVVINGFLKEFDVEPQLINSRTMVPMRAIFEEFGADVLWDEKTATATATSSSASVKITENSDIAYVDGKETKLDSPAIIINGRFLVPLRFISESFGADVKWADETQTAIISYVVKITSGKFDKVERTVKHNIENALSVKSSLQSGDDGSNTIDYIYDGETGTRWAFKKTASGDDGYGIFDLGESKTIDSVYLGFYTADKRTYNFSVYVSEDNKTYTPVKEKLFSTVKTAEMEKFDLGGAKGRYVKIVGHGNSANEWNNITELVFTGK